ncbi:MAG: leucyl/phenylalanyl-tRNA--protein transferase [Rhizobiaceae bacterium]|nr:leucyl/phenylalanyl-tRNA--protein transferase [Rhizobiaceae bacterium]
MPRRDHPADWLDPEIVLRAYMVGVFPMGQDADSDELVWLKPEVRGIIPLDAFHIPRSLAKAMRRTAFEFRFSTDFDGVIAGCAEAKPGRETTWINTPIRRAYRELFVRGHCHTVEAWQDGALVGGLYGITLGAAFFGESMFSRQTDASKMCLAKLVERLNERRFRLLDAQFITSHLARFGAIEVLRPRYEALLADAISRQARFL